VLLVLGAMTLLGAGGDAAPLCSDPDPATVRTDAPGPLEVGTRCGDWEQMTLVVDDPPAHGSTSWYAQNQIIRYRPEPGYRGQDAFAYHVVTEGGTSNSVTQSVTVDPDYDRAPVCWTAEDAARTGHAYPVRYPCYDADGDVLTPTVTEPPAHGTVTTSGHDATYAAPSDYTGVDRIGLSYDDGHGGVASGEVDFQVTEQHPPTCSDWLGTPMAGQVSPLPSFGGCNDDEGDPLTFSIASQPAHGVVSETPAGTWQIAVEQHFSGDDGFTMLVSDGFGGQVIRPMGLRVYDLDPPWEGGPPCESGHATVRAGDAVSVPLVCPEHLRYETSLEIVSPPAAGDGVLGDIDQATHTVTFTAQPGASGTATFTYRQVDSAGGRLEPGTMTIDILPGAPGSGAPAATAFGAAPAGSQRLARVLAAGLAVDVTLQRPSKVTLRAVLSRADARRLHLGHRPVEVARAARTLKRGHTRLHLPVTGRARRALRHAGAARITLTAAATDAAGLSRTLPPRIVRLRPG
jgi:hypothetical protein